MGRHRMGFPVFLLLVAGLALLHGRSDAGRLDFPLIFVQEPLNLESAGSRLVSLQPGGGLTVLTPAFYAAADPCVSFDGRRVLFAGKRTAEEPWDIWEMEVDGSGKLRVTAGLGDCREPAYLARAAVDAPNFRDRVRWITFTSTASGVIDELGRKPLTSLYAMSLVPVPARSERVLWRTTYNLGGDIAPTVLADGRVMFSSWQRQGYALMTISWAGENLNPFFGSHEGTVSQLSASELADQRRVVFIEREGNAGDRSGRLAEVSWRRPMNSYQVLSRGEGHYRTPQGVPGKGLMVAYARHDGDSFGLYWFDERRGRPGRRVFDDPNWHDVDPQPVMVRPEPVGRIPMVGFASVLDIPGFDRAGQLHCMNVYESDRPEVRGIRPGHVKWVRLVEGLPMTIEEAARQAPMPPANGHSWPPPFVRTRSLGEAPVEADGSFFVNVAGDVPFYIETLDEEGAVLMTMRAWTWVPSGDQRGCVGCHANPELAPVNRATDALIKAAPVNLMGLPE